MGTDVVIVGGVVVVRKFVQELVVEICVAPGRKTTNRTRLRSSTNQIHGVSIIIHEAFSGNNNSLF